MNAIIYFNWTFNEWFSKSAGVSSGAHERSTKEEIPSGPLGLWMSKEDRSHLTAFWLNLISGIELRHRGMVSGFIPRSSYPSRVRGKESAQEIGFLFSRVD